MVCDLPDVRVNDGDKTSNQTKHSMLDAHFKSTLLRTVLEKRLEQGLDKIYETFVVEIIKIPDR